MSRGLACVVVIALAGLVPAGAEAAHRRAPLSGYEYPAKNAAAKRRLMREREVTDVVNHAQQHVFATRPSCKPKSPLGADQGTTDAPPDPGFVAAIAALRRPATAADATPTRPDGHPIATTFGTTHTSSVRTLVAADGTHATLLVARVARHNFHLSASCIAGERAWVDHLLRGRSHAVRVQTRKLFAHIARDASKPVATTPPVDGLFLYAGHGNSGGGGGGATVKEFLARGMFFSSGGGPGARGRRSTLTGVVPDGVAHVTFQYPRVVRRGHDFAPTVYPHAYTRTVNVADNLVDLRVPRDAADAFAPRMVWRAADGSVVRVVRSPAGF